MCEKLKGKKLLYLGGIKRASYVVKRAREIGVYVIVADYNIDSPAKEVADEGVLLDAMNIGALVTFARNRGIDGVLTGYADILLPICLKVSQALKLPCYLCEEIISVSTDKIAFKKICDANNVPVPVTYSDSSTDHDEYINYSYPVLIKPQDASGSRGVAICKSAESFLELKKAALSYSKRKQITIEEQLTGQEFILDYFVVNGVPYMLSMADRYSTAARGAVINSPNLMILPSKNLVKYTETVDSKVKAMLSSLNFNNGIVFFQGYANNDRIAFYEMGCRLGGTWPYIDEYYNGINPLDMLFEYSLNGTISVEKDVVISPFFKGKAAIVYFLANVKEGKIGFINGVEEVSSYEWIVDVMQFYNEGDRFDSERQTDVRFLSVNIVADNVETLKQRINKVYEKIKIEGENHENLLADFYPTDNLKYDERN